MPIEVFVYILFFSIISILVVFCWGYFKRKVCFQKGSLFYNVLRFLQTIPLFILSGLAPQFSMSQPLHFQLVIITTKFRKRRQKGNWGNYRIEKKRKLQGSFMRNLLSLNVWKRVPPIQSKCQWARVKNAKANLLVLLVSQLLTAKILF